MIFDCRLPIENRKSHIVNPKSLCHGGESKEGRPPCRLSKTETGVSPGPSRALGTPVRAGPGRRRTACSSFLKASFERRSLPPRLLVTDKRGGRDACAHPRCCLATARRGGRVRAGPSSGEATDSGCLRAHAPNGAGRGARQFFREIREILS
jgi:hypothetical protein